PSERAERREREREQARREAEANAALHRRLGERMQGLKALYAEMDDHQVKGLESVATMRTRLWANWAQNVADLQGRIVTNETKKYLKDALRFRTDELIAEIKSRGQENS